MLYKEGFLMVPREVEMDGNIGWMDLHTGISVS